MSTKLFVGNLPWAVRDADLEDLLAAQGLAHAGVEVLLEAPDDEGRRRSRGFGFVRFDSEAEAGKARDVLSGTVLRGRVLKVDWATARQMSVGPGGRREGGRGPRPEAGGREKRRRREKELAGHWDEFFPEDRS